jgi:predicted CXXCH cytochrome family protein
MVTARVLWRVVPAIAGVLAVALFACTTEKLVFREPFNPPPDAAKNFLGYFTSSDKQTTCGNCHVNHQASWETTKHANAWADLQNSGHAQAFCNNCHSVNQLGNGAAAPAGYAAVPDTVYQDVQCESCHGAGLTHATTPDDRSTWPIAHVDLGPDTVASCAGCHNGNFDPFFEQWSQSKHADSAGNAEPASEASCVGCHRGQDALARLSGNEPTNYVELTGTKSLTITCAVCHDPHGSQFEGQLRAPINSTDPTVNLCTQCHFRNTTPTSSFTNSTATVLKRGAHAAQGGVFFGEGAGYIPTGFVYDTNQVFTSHASPTANPRLCAGCHVARFTVTDSSGTVQFQSVGHLFLPIPCVDAQGIPNAGDCAFTTAARNFGACTASGCHASVDVAQSLFTNERQNIKNLVDQLWTDDGVLNTDGEPYIDPATDTGLLPTLVQSNPTDPVTGKQAFNGTDNYISPAEGALFNAMMFAENLYSHKDGSFGVHNPFYYEAMLAASIVSVQQTYGLPDVSPKVQALIHKALTRRGVSYTGLSRKQVSAR